MKSDEEILQRIKAVAKRDFFGTERGDLVAVLSYEAAKLFIKPETTEDEWTPLPKDRESLISRMLDYMPFAWDKANNERGLSARRSLDHFTTWIWLAGDDLGSFENYEYYGKDELIRICEYYGWDHTVLDDNRRLNTG